MNNNLLPLTGFKMAVGENQFKLLQHFAVSANMPGVNIAEVSTTFRNLSGYVPSDHISYDALNVRVAVDENMHVYDEVFSWLSSCTTSNILPVHDIVLNFLTSKFNITRSVSFKNVFPVSISSIEFNVQNTEVDYAYIDVGFRYDNFTFDLGPDRLQRPA